MSLLNGVKSHAKLRQQLKTFNKVPFCECCCHRKVCKCTSITNKKRHTIQDLHVDIMEFMKMHHLSVYGIEKKISCMGLNGRVDGIFKANQTKNKLYLIEWKFCRYIPERLDITYIIQLNLYMYIMKQIKKYKKFHFDMYCFIFSTTQNNIKIFKCINLPDEFIKNFITCTYFKIKI